MSSDSPNHHRLVGAAPGHPREKTTLIECFLDFYPARLSDLRHDIGIPTAIRHLSPLEPRWLPARGTGRLTSVPAYISVVDHTVSTKAVVCVLG